MNQKSIILLLALVFCCAVCQGQVLRSTGQHQWTVSSAGPTPPVLTNYIDGIATMHFTLPDRRVNGSPYLQEEFMFGVMSTVDTVTIEGMRYRYNIYDDQMQFILKGDTASIIRPLSLREIRFGKVKFIYDVYYTSSGQAAAGYFEVLEEGRLSVLLRRTMKLEYDEYVPNYGGGGGSKEFYYRGKEHLYVKHVSALARNIRNKKEFLNLLPDHRDEVQNYMKTEKLSVKKQEDLKELVRYFNSL